MAVKRNQQPLAKPSLKTRMRSYARDHVRVLLFSLGKLYRTPLATKLHHTNDCGGTGSTRLSICIA